MTYSAITGYMTVANFLICCLIGLISLCRLRQDECSTDIWNRSRYSLYVGGAVACGWQPILFGSLVSEGTLMFSSTVLVSLVIDFFRWKKFGGINGTCPLY